MPSRFDVATASELCSIRLSCPVSRAFHFKAARFSARRLYAALVFFMIIFESFVVVILLGHEFLLFTVSVCVWVCVCVCVYAFVK